MNKLLLIRAVFGLALVLLLSLNSYNNLNNSPFKHNDVTDEVVTVNANEEESLDDIASILQNLLCKEAETPNSITDDDDKRFKKLILDYYNRDGDLVKLSSAHCQK